MRCHFTPTRMIIILKKGRSKTSVGEDVEKLELSNTADRDVKWCALLENSLKIPHKLNTVIIWPSNSTLGINAREMKVYVHTNTNTQVFIATLFIIGQKALATQIFISKWMDKQNVVYPCNRLSFSIKKEWSTDTWFNMDKSWKHYAKWKKPVTKDHILCDSIYMKCSEKGNLEK